MKSINKVFQKPLQWLYILSIVNLKPKFSFGFILNYDHHTLRPRHIWKGNLTKKFSKN